jgi:hypothetical protein
MQRLLQRILRVPAGCRCPANQARAAPSGRAQAVDALSASHDLELGDQRRAGCPPREGRELRFASRRSVNCWATGGLADHGRRLTLLG